MSKKSRRVRRVEKKATAPKLVRQTIRALKFKSKQIQMFADSELYREMSEVLEGFTRHLKYLSESLCRPSPPPPSPALAEPDPKAGDR